MGLEEMIAAAQQREQARQEAAAQAVRAREQERFTQDVARAFGETFLADTGGSVVYDGSPVLRVSYGGQQHDIGQLRHANGQRDWAVNGQQIFPVGREPEPQEAADQVVLEIVAQGQQPTPEPEPEPEPEAEPTETTEE